MPEQDWQSNSALAVVGVTALAFVWRALRKKNKVGGCGACRCGKTQPDLYRGEQVRSQNSK